MALSNPDNPVNVTGLSRFFTKLKSWVSSNYAAKSHTHSAPVVVSRTEPTNSDAVIWIKTAS